MAATGKAKVRNAAGSWGSPFEWQIISGLFVDQSQEASRKLSMRELDRDGSEVEGGELICAIPTQGNHRGATDKLL